jgi:hypothetical protein
VTYDSTRMRKISTVRGFDARNDWVDI